MFTLNLTTVTLSTFANLKPNSLAFSESKTAGSALLSPLLDLVTSLLFLNLFIGLKSTSALTSKYFLLHTSLSSSLTHPTFVASYSLSHLALHALPLTSLYPPVSLLSNYPIAHSAMLHLVSGISSHLTSVLPPFIFPHLSYLPVTAH